GSTISAGGDVRVGDNITHNTTIENNIILQSVTDDSITAIVDGITKVMNKKLEPFREFMEKHGAKSFQTADKRYNIESLTNANFQFLIGQAGHDKTLPAELARNLIGDGDEWIKSLGRALLKQGIPVSDDRMEIFQNYDWFIQVFLQKMSSKPGQEKTLRRLSFMAEAYQASLRYLCYIQMAQAFQLENKPKLAIISEFIQMEGNKFLDFDYASLLLIATDLLGQNGFMKEIDNFVEELTDTGSDLFGTSFFLETQRRNLMTNNIPDDDKLPGLLDEYLTALVYWLRKISFLANYRLVSIKEINLNYRLGSPEHYLHRYGEPHSFYNEGGVSDKSRSIQIKGSFTYSRSIILFRGNVLAACMKNIQDKTSYLSLSPLVIDKSVYADENTKQTPEIFYYSGYEKKERKSERQYIYTPYQKELPFGTTSEKDKYPPLYVKATNTNQSGLDELFEYLEDVFNPFKNEPS
ncbi:MAG: hypothetical protein H7Y01_15790, partial [Ferruginibacter sp.]|nr:hypothetical protein [Chitinophagaceae bacterium]